MAENTEKKHNLERTALKESGLFLDTPEAPQTHKRDG